MSDDFAYDIGAARWDREKAALEAERDAALARVATLEAEARGLRRRMAALRLLSADAPEGALGEFLDEYPAMMLGSDPEAYLDAAADALEAAGLLRVN